MEKMQSLSKFKSVYAFGTSVDLKYWLIKDDQNTSKLIEVIEKSDESIGGKTHFSD